MSVEVESMKRLERLVYITLLCGFAVALSEVVSNQRQVGADAIFRRIEIQDPSGHPRIILATDSDGTAQIRLTDTSGKKNSVIEQYRDGTTTLRFAGPHQGDSIIMSASQIGPGPKLFLRGNTDDQIIYLGSPEDDVPSPSLKAYAWGLYVSDVGFRPPHAAVGAYRDLKTGKISGFVYPQR